MRIIGMSEVAVFCAKRPQAEAPLNALLTIVSRADWRSTADAKHQFGEAAHIDGPNLVRIDMAEQGVRIEMFANFGAGSVRLKLTPRAPRWD